MKYLIFLFTILSLSACSSLSIQETHVKLTGKSKPQTFTYSNKSINNEYILNSLAREMLSHTRYPWNRRRSGQVFLLTGLDAQIDQDVILLTYFNGSQHSGKTYGTKINVPFQYELSSDENQKYLTLIPPKQFDIIPGRNVLMLPFDPLLSNEQVIEDIQHIYDQITPNVLFKQTITGEIDSPYPVDSIKYNFARVLGHVSTSGAYRDEFRLPFRNAFIPVAVKFFPYKNGSKISYTFDYPYEENSNATSTYNEQEVAKLKSIILNVVND